MAPYIHEDFPINPIAGSGICTQYKLDYTRPAICWDRDDWPDRNAYIYLLTDEERNEINQALYHFKQLELDGSEISSANFPLPTLAERLQVLALDLHHGKGFFIIRGLLPDDYSVEDNMLIFLGVSSYIGELRGKQTDDGQLFGHIRNAEALGVSQGSRPLKYSNRSSTFHNDYCCDIVALQTRSCAAQGGCHQIASARKVYEEMVRMRPEFGEVLKAPNWPRDIRRRFAASETLPLFFEWEGNFISSILPDALFGFDDLERPSDLPALSEIQVNAHNALQSLCRKHCISLSMNPGDLTLINNFGILHARDAFQDTRSQMRYLVRMWLKNPSLAWALPPALQHGNHMVFHDDAVEEDWNIVPDPEFQFQVYERQTP